MKKLLINILLGVAMLMAAYSCKKDADYTYQIGEPVIELKSDVSTALFGDSLVFTVHVSDNQVALSTVKAQLFFTEDMVSETVIRTKENGDYTGKIYIPYLKNIPDGTATMKFVLQNISQKITEQSFDIALSRPDFPCLTLVDEEGEEYLMKRESLYNYSVTGRFPASLSATIKSPKVGDYGNELLFGMAGDGQMTQGLSVDPINFAGLEGEAYNVTFNTLTYEAGPVVEMTFDGEDMFPVDANSYSVQKSFTQGQTIEVSGTDLADWWINPDYFTNEGDGNLTFLPVDGEYRVVAHTDKKHFSVSRMKGDNEATLGNDGHGALWLMGWGVGSPSLDSQFGWNPGAAYCVPEVSSKKYQITGIAGPEHGSSFGQRFRADYLDCKFFFQNDWGGEFSSLTLAQGSENLIKLTSSWNIGLADGVTLEVGATYVLMVDLTAGNDKGIISFEKR